MGANLRGQTFASYENDPRYYCGYDDGGVVAVVEFAFGTTIQKSLTDLRPHSYYSRSVVLRGGTSLSLTRRKRASGTRCYYYSHHCYYWQCYY